TMPDLKSALNLDGALNYKQKRVNLTLDLTRPMDVAAGKSSPVKLSVKTADMSVAASGTLATTGDMFKGNVDADVASLSAVLGWVGQAGTQPPFEKVSFKSAVTASDKAISLNGAALT